MSLIHRFIVAIILLQLSFTIVNATGIFEFKSGTNTWIKHDDIEKAFNEIKKRFSNASNLFDYLGAAAFTLVTGLEILLRFTASVFLGFPDVLRAFFVPDKLAIPIGYAVDALLVLGIGYLFIRRV